MFDLLLRRKQNIPDLTGMTNGGTAKRHPAGDIAGRGGEKSVFP